MRAFQNLFNQLDQVTGTKAKVQALVDHFQEVEAGEAAWALTLLLGKRRRRLITGRRLRDILRDRGGLPDWLIDDCYGQLATQLKPSACSGPLCRNASKQATRICRAVMETCP